MLKGYKIVLFTIFITQIQSCLSGDQYCARCGGVQCLKCWGAYTTPQGTCQKYNVALESCLVYASANACKECQLGFQLNSGKCVAISKSNCLKVNENGDCIACDQNNKVNNDLTCPEEADSDEECDTDRCQVCQVMAGQEKCLKCDAGHVIHSYDNDDGEYKEKCISQVGRTLNCNRTDHNSEVDCLECDVNYYQNYGKCVLNENLKLKEYTQEENNTMIYRIFSGIIILLLQLQL